MVCLFAGDDHAFIVPHDDGTRLASNPEEIPDQLFA
jgi:hypothetical protein